MSVTPRFHAVISPECELNFLDYAQVGQYLLDLKRKGVENVDVVITKPSRRKTSNQRKFYWAVILEILSNYTGHERTELHEVLKVKFLSYEDNGITYYRSTEDLTTAECEEYYEKIKRWAADELGVYIPDPNQVDIAGGDQ